MDLAERYAVLCSFLHSQQNYSLITIFHDRPALFKLPSVRSGDNMRRLWGCGHGDVISRRRDGGVAV